MNRKINIGIIGATGYVAMELARIISGHPHLNLKSLVSRSQAGRLFSEVYPAFRGVTDLALSLLDYDQLARETDLVITALPHGVSSEVVPQLLKRGLRVVDHSGDFRYRRAAVYEDAYNLKHPDPQLLDRAVYGLPELYRTRLADADLVANPGCYPTAAILALMPALRSGLIDPDSIIVDAWSGISGAGRQQGFGWSYSETAEGARAYGVVNHRHTSEIEQEAAFLAGLPELILTFTPHLAPMKRGILLTAYADLKSGANAGLLRDTYEKAYQDEPFVRFLPEGMTPDTLRVAYSNFAETSVFFDRRTGKVKLISAIDNLGKGAAGQAVQAINLMFGLPETSGLNSPGCLI